MWRLHRIAWKVGARVPPEADPSKLHNEAVWDLLDVAAAGFHSLDDLRSALQGNSLERVLPIVSDLRSRVDRLAEIGLAAFKRSDVASARFAGDIRLFRERVDLLLELANLATPERRLSYLWSLAHDLELRLEGFRDAAFEATDDPENFWKNFCQVLDRRAGLVVRLRKLPKAKEKEL